MPKPKGKTRGIRSSFDSVFYEAALIFISSFCGAEFFIILSKPLTFMTGVLILVLLAVLFAIVLIMVAVIKHLPKLIP